MRRGDNETWSSSRSGAESLELPPSGLEGSNDPGTLYAVNRIEFVIVFN